MRPWTRSLLALALPLTGCATSVHTAPTAYEASAPELATARAEILPLFEEMKAAANAHDTDRHLAAYLHSPALVFVVNDEAIHGWDALRERQLQWWQHGKSDAVYEVMGTPEYVMPASNVVVQTYFLDSHRSGANAGTHGAHLGVTDVWRRTADGWRIVYAHESVVPR